MLRSLHLRNFRCFEDHIVELSPTTLVVGKNNAGKTTIAEALRLVSIVTQRYEHLRFKHPPRILKVPRRRIGIEPSLKNLQIEYKTLCYLYQDPPAIVQALFSNGCELTFYLGPGGDAHVTLQDPDGNFAKSKGDLGWLELPRVEIMPQVAPLEPMETILRADYVRGALSSYLAPRHFRNQLNLYRSLFKGFQSAVEETWHTVQVRELVGAGGRHGDSLHLQIRDREFVGEVGAMGHGLQMWMQMIWFLVRSEGADTVILDEPDVFMHADLQRRLIRLVRGRFQQVIITTHSTEMMSEVSPKEIVLVDRRQPESRALTSLPAVQRIVAGFGSIHNIALTRLWGSKRLILIEGNDLYYLKIFQDILIPDTAKPLDAVPSMEIGGWGGWSVALGSAAFLTNAIEENIRVYCILDSDYHAPEEIAERQEEARTKKIELHIWSRKEIENYLLCAAVITRAVKVAMRDTGPSPEEEDVGRQLEQIARSLRDEAFDGIAHAVLARSRRLGAGGANKRAREIMADKEAQVGDCLGLVSGKRVLSGLFAWTRHSYGVSLNAGLLAREFRRHEIPDEVKSVVMALEYGRKFRSNF